MQRLDKENKPSFRCMQAGERAKKILEYLQKSSTFVILKVHLK